METNKNTKKQLWLPTRPYTIIGAINRRSAATGSARFADLASHADYNGHFVSVYFNDYRQYWVADYTWAGRIVLGRGTLANCLSAAKAEYDRGALGACVVVTVESEEDKQEAELFGFQPYSKEIQEAYNKTWQDDRFECLSEAFQYETHGLAPSVGLLANSKSAAEFKEKLAAYFAERKAARA